MSSPTSIFMSDLTAGEAAVIAALRNARAAVVAQAKNVEGAVQTSATKLVADATAIGSELHAALGGVLSGAASTAPVTQAKKS